VTHSCVTRVAHSLEGHDCDAYQHKVMPHLIMESSQHIKPVIPGYQMCSAYGVYIKCVVHMAVSLHTRSTILVDGCGHLQSRRCSTHTRSNDGGTLIQDARQHTSQVTPLTLYLAIHLLRVYKRHVRWEGTSQRHKSTCDTLMLLNSTKNSLVAAGWNPQLLANWIGKMTFQKVRLT